MAKHLETEAIQHLLAEIRKTPGVTHAVDRDAVGRLLALLRGDWFVSIAGYFLNHRAQSPYAQLDDEYKVQDLIYCLALSVIPDLQYEDPQQKTTGALASTRVDFSSARTRTFVEVKLATNTHTMKKVEAEIHEDITKYGRQRSFSHLIFFIYCHQYSPPSPREFERGLTGEQTIDGHRFDTYCIIKP
ncbi:MAG: hypothetical protein M1140_02210 [Chloroflexi bacterium]|nr:hypothetical protein [Chloroflexota bacterium]